MNQRKIKFYQTMLFHYLALYWVLHVIAAVVLFGFERGWGAFAYLWVFLPHLPVIFVATLVSLLAKKSQNYLVWLLALICFVLSNWHWVYGLFTYVRIDWQIASLILLTVIPIVATAQLIRLTKTAS
ncbi:hypothetical protein ACVR1I_01675 [Streptococcus cameli]